MQAHLWMAMQSSGVQGSGAALTAVATERIDLLWPAMGS